jgi:hypothetical protein
MPLYNQGAPFHFIPHPDMDWRDWADSLVGFNPVLRGQVDEDADWAAIGERLIRFDGRIPNPNQFDDWRDWVRAMKSTLNV